VTIPDPLSLLALFCYAVPHHTLNAHTNTTQHTNSYEKEVAHVLQQQQQQQSSTKTTSPKLSPTTSLTHSGPSQIERLANIMIFAIDVRSGSVQDLLHGSRFGEICWYLPRTREQFRISGELHLLLAPDHPLSVSKAVGKPFDSHENSRVVDGFPALDWERRRLEIWRRLSAVRRASFTWPAKKMGGELEGEAVVFVTPTEEEQEGEHDAEDVVSQTTLVSHVTVKPITHLDAQPSPMLVPTATSATMTATTTTTATASTTASTDLAPLPGAAIDSTTTNMKHRVRRHSSQHQNLHLLDDQQASDSYHSSTTPHSTKDATHSAAHAIAYRNFGLLLLDVDGVDHLRMNEVPHVRTKYRRSTDTVAEPLLVHQNTHQGQHDSTKHAHQTNEPHFNLHDLVAPKSPLTAAATSSAALQSAAPTSEIFRDLTNGSVSGSDFLESMGLSSLGDLSGLTTNLPVIHSPTSLSPPSVHSNIIINNNAATSKSATTTTTADYFSASSSSSSSSNDGLANGMDPASSTRDSGYFGTMSSMEDIQVSICQHPSRRNTMGLGCEKELEKLQLSEKVGGNPSLMNHHNNNHNQNNQHGHHHHHHHHHNGHGHQHGHGHGSHQAGNVLGMDHIVKKVSHWTVKEMDPCHFE
jgi:hypothetical protein